MRPRRPPRSRAAEKPKGDAIPGAELEPIRIEDDRPLSTEERARAEAEAEEKARQEAAAADEPGDEAPRTPTVEIPSESRIQATGKRKTAIARVIVTPGKGEIVINKPHSRRTTSPATSIARPPARRSSPPATTARSTSRSAFTAAASAARPTQSATASPAP